MYTALFNARARFKLKRNVKYHSMKFIRCDSLQHVRRKPATAKN